MLKLEYVLSNSFDKSKDSIIICWQRGKIIDETMRCTIPEEKASTIEISEHFHKRSNFYQKK